MAAARAVPPISSTQRVLWCVIAAARVKLRRGGWREPPGGSGFKGPNLHKHCPLDFRYVLRWIPTEALSFAQNEAFHQVSALTNRNTTGVVIPAECPFCRLPLLQPAVAVLGPGQHHRFDATALVPADTAAAEAARVTGPVAASAWRAMRLVESMPSGILQGPTWATAQALARRALAISVMALNNSVADGPQATVTALTRLRETASHLRAGGVRLSGLVETRRVCGAIDAIARALIAHVTMPT